MAHIASLKGYLNTAKALLFTSVLLLVFAVCSLQAYAQENASADETPGSCPVAEVLLVSMSGLESAQEPVTVDQTFVNELRVFNSDPYYQVPGVRVGVAFYSRESSVLPAYIMVLPEEYLLAPALETTIPVSVDLAELPAGEFVVKAFAAQGGINGLLGAMIKEVAMTTGFKIQKDTPAVTTVNTSITVNGELFSGDLIEHELADPAAITIVTANNTNTVVKGMQVYGVLSYGTLPLGAAVQNVRMDEVSLISQNSKRETKLGGELGISGPETLYVTMTGANKAWPLIVVPMRAGGVDAVMPWPYLSTVSVVAEGYTEKPEVVACVEYTEEIDVIGAPGIIGSRLMVENTVRVEGLNDSTTVGDSKENSGQNYFTFATGGVTGALTIEGALFMEKFSSDYDPNDPNAKITPQDLDQVQKYEYTIPCDTESGCGAPQTEATEIVETFDRPENSAFPWQYLIVVVLLILVIVIVGLRLVGSRSGDQEPGPDNYGTDQ